MTERTLALIKPNAVRGGHVGHILTRVEVDGFQLVDVRLETLRAERVDALYAEHLARDFYPAMRAFMVSGPIATMILQGPCAVARWRRACGATDPRQALRDWRCCPACRGLESWSHTCADWPDVRSQTDRALAPLRALYGDRTGVTYENAVHGSDSPASAAREIALFFGGKLGA
jgi:nucleoside-diphosphate kinase